MAFDRGDMSKKLVEKVGMISKKQARAITDAFIDIMLETLATGTDVKFMGFGKWFVKSRPERTGRNPQTGDSLQIPATRVVRFKAGKQLRGKVKSV